MNSVGDTHSPHRAITLLALVAAGEAAFFLPFLVARVFRPTVLEVFNLTNLQLGTAYGVYGAVAMAAYLLGGPLADRFAARNMLVIALVTTALGGLVLFAVPTLTMLITLYAWWGVTTIALLWAPLIRATREWGGDDAQGTAFGLLDGGRGLLAAITASILVMVFAGLLPVDPNLASLDERTDALKQVILMLFAITLATAVLTWFVLPAGRSDNQQRVKKPRIALHDIQHVFAMPTVWLQALIVLCAYVGFRSIDDFALYANEVLGMNEAESAQVGTVSLWIRPIAAVAAGLLADRLGTVRMTLVSFILLATGSSVLASGIMLQGTALLFMLIVITTSLGIFALRGLYFAIMREGKVPLAVTGTAVGFVSVIGYTPDVFMGPLMGWLLDRSPGAPGHQDLFALVTTVALLGIVATVLFQRATQR
ncbi:MAG: MFS transporter [Gammaproteobacteria bacterium]|nr:MFS transporter [Gammaproteobacteria bacterium]